MTFCYDKLIPLVLYNKSELKPKDSQLNHQTHNKTKQAYEQRTKGYMNEHSKMSTNTARIIELTALSWNWDNSKDGQNFFLSPKLGILILLFKITYPLQLIV